MIFPPRERNIEEARAALLWPGPTEQFLSEQSGQPHQRPLPPGLQAAGQSGDLRRGENSQVSQWIPRGHTGGQTGAVKTKICKKKDKKVKSLQRKGTKKIISRLS